MKIRHANGTVYDVVVGARRALIDPQGVIRFFSVDYDDGDTQAYKLHPRHSKTAERFGWVLDFLAGYGLSRLGGRLIKPRPGLPTHQAEAVLLSRHFTFSNPGGSTIRSYIARLFSDEQLGYHNVVTDELIWDDVIRLRMS